MSDDPRTVTLKNVRLSFTESLKDKKATVENGTPKHSCNLIIIKDGGDDPLLKQAAADYEKNHAAIVGAVKAACDEQWAKPDKWKEIAEDDPKRLCYRKGERFKNREGEVYAGYAGNWAISAGGPKGGKERPLLLDRRKNPVPEDEILDVMAGGYLADAIVSFYGTDKGGAGVFCSIEAIRSREEGEKMGGGPRASADDFDDLEDDDSFGGGSNNDADGNDFDDIG